MAGLPEGGGEELAPLHTGACSPTSPSTLARYLILYGKTRLCAHDWQQRAACWLTRTTRRQRNAASATNKAYVKLQTLVLAWRAE